MSVLTQGELDKLAVMYEGDKSRDASDKIRGFLFQDYIAVERILQDHVEDVCVEYLEDVDVFREDGVLEIIQVKYYPKTRPKKKEIFTDLYYQYLRLKILKSNMDIVPSLYIHGDSKVELTLKEMIEYVKENELPDVIEYEKINDPDTWLKENIYRNLKQEMQTKKEQKKSLFEKMASKTTLEKFVTKCNIFQKEDIDQLKKNLMETLARIYPNPESNGDNGNWQLILMGLAISYVHRRYTLDNDDFEQLRMNKKKFDQYMRNSAEIKTEKTITSYLLGIICEKYSEIINYNNLSELQVHMLDLIYRNTLDWINENSRTVEGQYQLLNTFGIDEFEKLIEYKEASISIRLKKMTENKTGFWVFLSYLWKIMLNICQERVNNEEMISKNLELFDPVHYMVSSVKSYICFDFYQDKYFHHSIILPRAGGEFKGIKRKIVGRMMKMLPKPEKWFFENSKLIKGKNYYDYSTANVVENPTIVDLGEDIFYIECMDCIGIDEDEWDVQETCSDCIFTEKCKKERNEL